MLKDLFDLLLHRVPWNGDRIRLYRWLDKEDPNRTGEQAQEFIGEYYLRIQSGEVFVPPHGYIRRDLPRWSGRSCCWFYYYTPSGGE